MKKLFSLFLFFLIQNLFAQIVEVKNFEKIREFLSPDTLILVDIDNTLLRPAQSLGSDQWFGWKLKDYQAHGMTYEASLNKLMDEYEAIQKISDFQCPEATTAAILAQLQSEKYLVMGLTMKSIGLAQRTSRALNALNIHLERNGLSANEKWFITEKPLLLKEGIFFTNGTCKAKALFQLLEKLKLVPKSILFIDDRESHLIELESACHEKNIPFTGLRYSYLDEWVKSLSPEICEVQLEKFKKILSDDEAKELLPHLCIRPQSPPKNSSDRMLSDLYFR